MNPALKLVSHAMYHKGSPIREAPTADLGELETHDAIYALVNDLINVGAAHGYGFTVMGTTASTRKPNLEDLARALTDMRVNLYRLIHLHGLGSIADDLLENQVTKGNINYSNVIPPRLPSI